MTTMDMKTLSPAPPPMLETTPEVAELAKALAAAQFKITAAAKDRKNPHFGSNYADLASVWDACREALGSNGLAVHQAAVNDASGAIGVITTLMHASGQWMRSTLWMRPEKAGPQAAGSVLTYARRYALAAAVGVAPDDDDDGNQGQQAGRPNGKPAARQEDKPKAPRADTVTHDGTFASTEQVKLLHTLRGKIGGLTEDMYRKQLAAFRDPDGKPVATSTDLSEGQIDNLIGRYKAQIDRQAKRMASEPLRVPGDPPEGPQGLISTEGVTAIESHMMAKGMASSELCAIFGIDRVDELTDAQSADALALVLSYGTQQHERVLAAVREKEMA